MSKKIKAAEPVGLANDELSPEFRRQKKRLLAQRVKQVDVAPGMSAASLVESMSGMSIQARNVGTCAQVLGRMYTDKRRPTVLLGLAG